jgi:hypothetical protein
MFACVQRPAHCRAIILWQRCKWLWVLAHQLYSSCGAAGSAAFRWVATSRFARSNGQLDEVDISELLAGLDEQSRMTLAFLRRLRS